MHEFGSDWLNAQIRSRFRDLPGARLSLHLPLPDHLLSRFIAERLPTHGRIREISVRALRDDAVKLRVRLAGSALLPAIYVQLRIVEQPRWPESPILILRLVSQGLALLAGNALRLFNKLPPGIAVRDDLVRIDLVTIASQYGMADLLSLLTALRFTTESGRIVVDLDVSTPDTERSGTLHEPG